MKNMQLSNLRKRKSAYFKKLGDVRFESKKISDYISKRSYEALPKRLKEYVKDEKEQLVKIISNLISSSGEEGIDVYKAIKSYASNKFDKVYSTQKKEVWESFKAMESSVYYHYNSYIYRLGYSASKYWFENVDFTNIEGSLVTTELELPKKINGVIYNTLEIIHDFSTGYTEAFMY